MYGYIYKIENVVNNKIYIGQTTQDLERRKAGHLHYLKYNKHENGHLQNAWNKYGEDNFKFVIINWCNSQDELDTAEIHYINEYGCLDRDKGYNIQLGGSNGKLSPETKLKISKALTGIKRSEETIRRSVEARKGKTAWNKGKKCPQWGGKNHHTYGKKMSLEIRKKISKSLLGKNHPMYEVPKTLEQRLKLSKSKRGKSLFGFTGTSYHKRLNPENKCWNSKISYKGKGKSLGYFEDPLSAEIVYDLVFNEIYGELI